MTLQIYIKEGGRSSLIKNNISVYQSPLPPASLLNLMMQLNFHLAQPRKTRSITVRRDSSAAKLSRQVLYHAVMIQGCIHSETNPSTERAPLRGTVRHVYSETYYGVK